MVETRYTTQPIGVIRSELTSIEAAPLQGDEGAPAAWLEVWPHLAQGLAGMRTGDELLVLTWLQRSRRDVLQVHPRGRMEAPLTGVFATRSPDRPNPIGLHPVTVLEVAGHRLRVAPMEAIDGTPIIDIKPTLKNATRHAKVAERSHSQSSQTDDKTAVRDLYQQLIDSWNRGDAEAYAAPFAEDGILVGFDGRHFAGRREIVAFHQPLFDKWLKGTRLVGAVKRVQFLTPEVAVMHAVGSTIMRGQSKPSPARDSIQTLVARREDSEWKLAAFQNTRLRPMSRNFASAVLWIFTDWLWKIQSFTRRGTASDFGRLVD